MIFAPGDAPPRVKICCIASPAEARTALRWGASAIGLVSRMPSGPGVITEERIAEIVRSVPPQVSTFLLTALHDPEAIEEQQGRTGANTLQLVDRLEPAALTDLRARLPLVRIVQVVHVLDEGAIDEALAAEPYVDSILLDSGNPLLEVKELGGTGRTHDWALSRRVVEEVAVPVWLAGGLDADNVAGAIARVAPFGLDLCSSVRTEGALDEVKLGAFMGSVAFAVERAAEEDAHARAKRGVSRSADVSAGTGTEGSAGTNGRGGG
jgi:phosphoribosylanthranilate isomerase